MEHFPGGLAQQVELQSEWEEQWQQVDTAGLISTQDSFTLLLPVLLPHTRYTARVRMRPAGRPGSPLSPAVVASGRTRAAPPPRPASHPAAWESGTDSGENSRAVRLYWQPVPPSQQAGPDFHYQVETGTGVRQDPAAGRGSALLPSLPCTPLNLALTAVNTAGRSPVVAVTVPGCGDAASLLPRSLTRLWREEGGARLMWLAPISLPARYTLFWCQTEQTGPGECDQLAWQEISPTDLQGNLTGVVWMELRAEQAGAPLALATTSQSDLTSGLVWVGCTVRGGRGAARLVTLPSAAAVSSTAVLLSWQLDCAGQALLASNSFVVRACSAQQGCSTTRLPAGGLETRLTGLLPHTSYTFTVQAEDPDSGVLGPASAPVHTTTHPAPPSPPTRLRLAEGGTKLLWDPPALPNGELCEYRLLVAGMGVDHPVPARGEGGAAELPPLPPYTAHTALVWGCTADLSGSCRLCDRTMPANLSFTTAVGPPGPPNPPSIAFPNSSTLHLAWDTDFQVITGKSVSNRLE